MYGYSFGTAAANVWHHVDYEAMLYPGYTTYGAFLCSLLSMKERHFLQNDDQVCGQVVFEPFACS